MSVTIFNRMAERRAEVQRIISSGRVAELMDEFENLCRGKTVSVCISGNCDAYSVESVGSSFLTLTLCKSIKFKVAGRDVPFGFFNVAVDCDAVFVVEARSLAESTAIFIEEAPELRPCLNFFSDDGKPVLTDANYFVYRLVVQSTIADIHEVVWNLELFSDFDLK